jgi:hypothetical protein
MGTLVTYVFHKFNENVRFFLEFGYVADPTIHWRIIINDSSYHLDPKLYSHWKNIRVINRDNIGYDFGGYSYSIFVDPVEPMIKYDYYVFINSSVRGPFLPMWNRSANWVKLFTQMINATTKLGGSTIGIFNNLPHIQTMVFATDRVGLEIGMRHGIFSQNSQPLTRNQCIIEKEVAYSTKILQAGYNIQCLLPAYANVDFRTITGTSPNINPFIQDENYFKLSLHPYEVIFIKDKYNSLTSMYTQWQMKMKENQFPQHYDPHIGTRRVLQPPAQPQAKPPAQPQAQPAAKPPAKPPAKPSAKPPAQQQSPNLTNNPNNPNNPITSHSAAKLQLEQSNQSIKLNRNGTMLANYFSPEQRVQLSNLSAIGRTPWSNTTNSPFINSSLYPKINPNMFDWIFYVTYHSDVYKANIRDYGKAKDHYDKIGRAEGRIINPRSLPPNRYYLMNLNTAKFCGLCNQLWTLVNGLMVGRYVGRNICTTGLFPERKDERTIPLSTIFDLHQFNNVLTRLGFSIQLTDNINVPWKPSPTAPKDDGSLLQRLANYSKDTDEYLKCPFLFTYPLLSYYPDDSTRDIIMSIFNELPFNSTVLSVINSITGSLGLTNYIAIHLRLEDDMINHIIGSFYKGCNKTFDECSKILIDRYFRAIQELCPPGSTIYVATYLSKSNNANNHVLNRLRQMYPKTNLCPTDWRKQFPSFPQGREIDAIVDYIISTRATKFIGMDISTFSESISYTFRKQHRPHKLIVAKP